jgi:serpin B
MHRIGHCRFAEKDGVKALELSYKGGSTSMLVVLPNAVDGLAAFEKSMSVTKLGDLSKALADRLVEVSFPRFEVKPGEAVSLPEILKSLGMTLALDRNKADFTGIANPPSPSDRLYIAKAFHKAFVKVDEKGTEAAAATAVVMGKKNGARPEKSVEFKADHPFLFFVRDNESGLILFMGRVADPISS